MIHKNTTLADNEKFKKIHTIIFILLIIILFTGSAFATYNISDFLAKINDKKEDVEIVKYDLPTVSSNTPILQTEFADDIIKSTNVQEKTSPKPEIWTGNITIIPKNTKLFKTVSEAGPYKANLGKVYFNLDNDINSWPKMSIINKNLDLYKRDSSQLDNLDLIKKFIDESSNIKYLDVKDIDLDKFDDQNPDSSINKSLISGGNVDFIFSSNSEYYSSNPKVSSIRKIEYPGTDKAIVLPTIYGIYILAYKGDNLIQLQQLYKNRPIPNKSQLDLCSKYGQSPEAEKCGASSLINWVGLENAITESAIELLEIFTLN